MLRTFALFRNGFYSSHGTRRSARGRRLTCESLETRRMLATDFGGVSGVVFADLNNDGVLDGGESGIAGVQVRLRQGATTIDTVTTDVTGMYQFTGLTEGTYQLEQLTEEGGFSIRPGASPVNVMVTAMDAAGTAGPVVDNFDGVAQLVMAPADDSASSTVADPDAIGGNRDLFARSLSAAEGVVLSVNDAFGGLNTLRFGPVGSALGQYLITWDGDDVVTVDSGASLNATGLGGEDLTGGGVTTAFTMLAGMQEAGQMLTIRVYTDAANFSTAMIPIPETPAGAVTDEVIVPFSSFVTGGGGGADFTNVGALQLEHIATMGASDGGIDQFGTIGPRFVVQNIANIPALNLAVAKSVDTSTPDLGANVVYTIQVTNQGPADATGIELTEVLPAGMTFVSAIPSQGTYDSATGLWTVGALAATASATLQITATVDTLGDKTNSVTLTEVDQPETNETDNTAAVVVTPQAIDLAVTKAVNNAMPFVGSAVSYTITVSNVGPSVAQGVTVSDPLAVGLTFNSSAATQGSYNNATGIWTIGMLGVGGTATLTINATPTIATTITNTAQVSAASPVDTNLTNNQASASITPLIPPAPAISVSKSTNGTATNTSTGGPFIPVGNLVTFDYVVTNTGNVPLANVQVRDDNGTPNNVTDDFFANFVAGDNNNNTLLDVEEAWLYTSQRTATLGTHVNRVVVTAASNDVTVQANSVSNHTGFSLNLTKRRFLASSFA